MKGRWRGILRVLLFLYPRPLRRRFGEEMIDHLLRDFATGRGRGGVRGALAEAARLAAFVGSGVAARLNGPADGTREEAASRRPAPLEGFLRDVRFDVRTLRRRPGSTAAAVVVLGLGVAMNVAVFSMAVGVLRPTVPGVPHPDRLVSVFQYKVDPGYHSSLSLPTYRDYRDDLPNVEDLAAWSSSPANLVHDGRAERIELSLVSPNYFRTLKVSPRLGRAFDSRAGQDADRRSVILSHDLWHRLFDASSDAVGRQVRLGGGAFTIVGVAPPAFRGLEMEDPADAWVTLAARDAVTSYDESWVQGRTMHWLESVGRLADGATFQQVGAAVDALGRALAERFPEEQGGWEARTLPLREALLWPEERAAVRDVTLEIAAVSLLVLLLACVTLAGMTLADLAARRSESAIRLALGAGRAHLVRHQMARATLVSLGAAAFGLGVGYLLVEAATAWRLIPNLPPGVDLRPDGELVRAVLLTMPLLALLVGVLPAIHAARSVPAGGLAVRTGRGGPRVGPIRRVLSVVQVAISVAVIAAAGTLLRSARAQLSHDLGFDPRGVLLASVDPSRSGYDDAEMLRFYRRGQELLEEIPGVESVAVAAFVPLKGPRLGASVEILTADGAEASRRVTGNIVTPGYFRTLDIPILRGRDLRDGDLAADEVLINETAARRFWGDADPLGRSIDTGSWLGGPATVVGVVGDLGAERALLTDPTPAIFIPYAKRTWSSGTFHVGGRGPVSQDRVEAVRNALQSLDPAVPVFDIGTMEATVRAALAPAVAIAGAVTLFGVLGLLLAAAGIYGVVAQSVARRRHEFGVRLAVGAGRRHVVQLVVREGLAVFGAGSLLGVAGAYALAGVVRVGLFGVAATDPLTVGGAVLVTAGAVAAALVVPARQATAVAPVDALRES